jgi:hypothetical protein
MTHIYTTFDIQAPPDQGAALRDIEHWPEWTPTVISIRPLDPGPLDVGDRAIGHQPKLLPAHWQITELEEGRSFSWIARGSGIPVAARHTIEDIANGTRTTLSLDFSGLGPLCARLTRDLNTRYLALEAQGLKKHAEAKAQSHALKTGSAGGSR